MLEYGIRNALYQIIRYSSISQSKCQAVKMAKFKIQQHVYLRNHIHNLLVKTEKTVKHTHNYTKTKYRR